jgi:hypothetical protein
MNNINDAKEAARTWLSNQIDLELVPWPDGAHFGGPREDYVVFRVSAIGRTTRVGGDRFIAVHRTTGEVRDLGYLGE